MSTPLRKLYIEQTAWEKIEAYTDICKDEISGLGKVEIRDGEIVVTDVAIFEQVVSGAHSTIEVAALAKFQEERIRAGESMKPWVFWWHSHATMSAFFSGTDTSTISSSSEFPYLVSMVTNKKHETVARLDVFSPLHLFVDLEVEILTEENAEVREACKAEIDAKVKSSYSSSMGFGSNGYKGGKFYLPSSDSPAAKLKDVKPWEKDYPEESSKRLMVFGLDLDQRIEYWAHRDYLKKAVTALSGIPEAQITKKQKKRLNRLQEQLKAHVEWGKLMNVEPIGGFGTGKHSTKHTSDLLPNPDDVESWMAQEEERGWGKND